MACRPTSQGYEESRFETRVDETFHCSICLNVVKEPRMCRNNDHVFCLFCISEHLNVNPQKCPECGDDLSVYTLRRPRLVINYLSKLKIKCDFASRGCPEFTCVENLESHVDNCGFAPVLCSNEECGKEINKRDRVYHASEVCEYRKVKCHDCGQIREVVGRLEGRLTKLDGKVEAGNQDMVQVKNEVEDVKEHVIRVSEDVKEVKVMMAQMLEKLKVLELRNTTFARVYPQNTAKQDILIAGGKGRSYNIGKSAEIYSWEKNAWFKVNPMDEDHIGASSFVYEDQLFVVGGRRSSVIETSNLNELPLKWTRFPGELPFACDDHQTVVCQNHVILIGGYNYDQDERSCLISELQLTIPCVSKTLCQMPKARDCHGAEIFDDKILILGGQRSLNSKNAMDSVQEFDIRTKDCIEKPSLPHALKHMATVGWKDKVLIFGGLNSKGEILKDAFMYDSKTGEMTPLPPMLEKRCACCAVITGNTVVIMGGKNDKKQFLNSVEYFTLGDYKWKYLPDMNNARFKAVAQALPSTRKYV